MTYQNQNTQTNNNLNSEAHQRAGRQKPIHLITLVIRSNYKNTGYFFHVIGLRNDFKKLAIENRIPPSMMQFIELKRRGAEK